MHISVFTKETEDVIAMPPEVREWANEEEIDDDNFYAPNINDIAKNVEIISVDDISDHSAPE